MIAEPKRILIIKPSSLGDIVHALPFLHALRVRFPKAHLAWLVKEEWAPLLVGHPDLDQVVSVRFRLSEAGRLFRAVRGGFDCVIDLQGLFRSGLLSLLSGATTRVGLSSAREGAGMFYTASARIAGRPMHGVDRYLKVCPLFDMEVPRPLFLLPDLSAAGRSLDGILRSHRVPENRPWIGIHASARERPKRWPPERFAELADRLAKDQKAALLFIGGRGEQEEIQAVLDRMSEPAHNLAGRTTLLELAALLSRVRLLVCNDSGPMHLAAALGTRVVGLFGPTDPREVGPYGEGHSVLKADWDCSPCRRSRCVQDGACLRALSVEQVLGAVNSLLEV